MDSIRRAAYLICTTPRSGSWLLADGLNQTGLAGHPQEYFTNHVAYDPAWGVYNRDNVDAYFRRVRAAGRTGNGVWGAKMHWSQLRYLAGVVGDDVDDTDRAFDRMTAAFGPLTVIRLERADKVRQALSYHRAIAENRWWRYAGEECTASDYAGPANEEIAQLIALLERHERRWDELIARLSVPVHRIRYEDLAAGPGAAVLDCLLRIGVPLTEAVPAVSPTAPRLVRQSDERTDLWVHQFLSWRRRHAKELR